jgi:large subunit ribosomal protein L16
LKPNRTKFRKHHLILKKKTVKSLKRMHLSLEGISLQAKTMGFVNGSQMEAARKIIRRKIRRFKNVLRIPTIPYTSITRKPVEVRMGKGKGNVHDWVIPIRPGKVLFEIIDTNVNSITRALYIKALKMAAKKLSVLTAVVCF